MQLSKITGMPFTFPFFNGLASIFFGKCQEVNQKRKIQALFDANLNLTRKNKCAIMILAREGSCVPARFIF
jgi:hypothetical protein